MQAYNIEIFDSDFGFVCADTVPTLPYKFDYLHPEQNTITIVTDAAILQGDYIHITRNDEEYFGIVSGTNTGDAHGTVNIDYKPFLSVFDTEILFDTDLQGQGTLEAQLATIITAHWINNSDSYQNITGLTVTTSSATSNWGFNLKSDTEGQHHLICNFLNTFIIRAMEKYSVAIKVVPDFSTSTINLVIGTIQEAVVYIEADLPSVIKKNVSVKDSDFDVNKLVVWSTADYTTKATYYRHTDDTYSTTNTDRITPVVLSTKAVTPDDTNTFAKLAASQASETFGSIEYNNLIELTVLPDDTLVNPLDMEIGQKVIVLSDGTEYNSVYTGFQLDGGLFTVIFGTVRLDLTKILQRRI